MTNLDTCLKASDTIRPLTPWCENLAYAYSLFTHKNSDSTLNDIVVEKGLHFGKWHWRYCERIPSELVDTFNENPLAYEIDRAILRIVHKFLKKGGENEST